jgi:hypothetical protein
MCFEKHQGQVEKRKMLVSLLRLVSFTHSRNACVLGPYSWVFLNSSSPGQSEVDFSNQGKNVRHCIGILLGIQLFNLCEKI